MLIFELFNVFDMFSLNVTWKTRLTCKKINIFRLKGQLSIYFKNLKIKIPKLQTRKNFNFALNFRD